MKTCKTAPGLTDSAVQWLWHWTASEPFWSRGEQLERPYSVTISFLFLFKFHSSLFSSFPRAFFSYFLLSSFIFTLFMSSILVRFFLSLIPLSYFLSYIRTSLPFFCLPLLFFSLYHHFSFFFISAIQLCFRFFQLSITSESLFYHHVWTKIILNSWPQTKWDYCAEHFKYFISRKC